MFCKEATPKTRHYTEPVGIRSCSWAVLPNLNVPSALTHTSRSSQKAQSSPRDTGTGYTPAWFRLCRAGQERPLSETKPPIAGEPLPQSAVPFAIAMRRVLSLGNSQPHTYIIKILSSSTGRCRETFKPL